MAPTLQDIPIMVADSGRALARRLVAPSQTPLLPWVPKYLKVLFLLLVLLNSSSFPFMWHIRVWFYPMRGMLLERMKGVRKSFADWRAANERGGGLARYRAQVWRRALFDDCDYNMHMSNSCYAKNSDAAKMRYAIDSFAPGFKCGMHMALGASHWQYIREIPIGTKYLMETRMGGWGEKWVHIVTEFVIFPPKGKGKDKKRGAGEVAKPTVVPTLSIPPSTDDSGRSSPATGGPVSAEDLVKRLSAQAREPRADGGIVACIAVTDYCFKQGRVTIPPRIAMHLSLLSPNEERRQHAMDIILSKDGGAAFARGGWKEDPLANELGRDIGLGPDGTQTWAEDAKAHMDEVNAGLLQVVCDNP